MDGGISFVDLELANLTSEPYVLSWQVGLEEDGEAEISALAIMKREDGVLLAIPSGFLPNDLVNAGNLGLEDSVFGPSVVFTVPSVIIEGGSPSPTGGEVDVLVVDCLPSVVEKLRRFSLDEEIVYGFDDDSPFALPSLDALMPRVREWLSTVPELDAFYTPDEAEQDTSAVETPPQRRRPPPRKGTPSGDAAKPKRATTASLASELQVLTEALPRFSQQLEAMTRRQDLMETRLVPAKTSSSMIAAQPLGRSLALPAVPPLGVIAKTVGAPPRTLAQQNLGLLGSPPIGDRPMELGALEEERQFVAQQQSSPQDSSLALAVLEQSKALTTLVQQIAAVQSDPMNDLAATSSSASTRGAAGRARLQAELAAHRGTFFQAVVNQMSRRMAPTSSAELSPLEQLHRGVSGLRYLERFGGYARQRELGQLQYQVMTVFDFLMEDNINAAKDSIALLAVTIEQSCLDGGRMDLATMLCLQEDPPAGIFQNRQLASTSRARSFAPLADQKWITSSLAFLKELEVITAKRAEMVGTSKPSDPSSDPSAKAKPKAYPKKKGKGKGQQQSSVDDAEQA